LGDGVGLRFSIVMPVYNREAYLRQAIDSVLSQTFSNFELIAVDDGSTDGSADILKSYGSRVRQIRQRNQGPEAARNAGLALAQGEYVVLLDSDDFLFPFALATYDRIIRAFGSPPVVIGTDVYYRDGEPLPAETQLSCPQQIATIQYKDFFSKDIAITNFHNKLAVRTSLLRDVGGFGSSARRTWYNDDLHTILTLGIYGPCVVVIKPRVVAYRHHASNSVQNVKAVADGMFDLARLEREGLFPGGRERRWDRYALIGGRSSSWAFKYCWRTGQRKLALQLLFGTAPMVLVAVWRKCVLHFRGATSPTVLPEQ
jgi:glycosyltransferase involved in cell wall biosynthesis